MANPEGDTQIRAHSTMSIIDGVHLQIVIDSNNPDRIDDIEDLMTSLRKVLPPKISKYILGERLLIRPRGPNTQ